MALVTDIELLALLDKYHAGTCTPAELEQLQNWFNSTSDDDARWLLPESIRPRVTSQMLAQFKERLAQQERRVKVVRVRRMAAIAATVLIAIAGAVAFYYTSLTSKTDTTLVQGDSDVAPGHIGAILTLSDGSTVELDSAGNGIIATQSGVQVQHANGQLRYDTGEDNNAEPVYNTLATPKARQYNLVLPDGTRVWLNAGSSIKYPVAFTANERSVSITGEAYFEVAHQATPFKVKANGTEIVDLGTAFNVYAYDDEPALKATLLQGAIAIQNRVLKPGQQAQVKGNNMQVVKLPDADDVIAWKNGEISFDNADVATLLRQLSRWYNIEVVYRGKVPAGNLVGTVSRQTNLSTIVKVLNTYGIPCKIEGNRLVVLGP